jgi:hypothetical protein
MHRAGFAFAFGFVLGDPVTVGGFARLPAPPTAPDAGEDSAGAGAGGALHASPEHDPGGVKNGKPPPTRAS